MERIIELVEFRKASEIIEKYVEDYLLKDALGDLRKSSNEFESKKAA